MKSSIEKTAVQGMLIATAAAVVLSIIAQIAPAEEPRWINVTPKLPGYRNRPSVDPRRTIGPVSGRREGGLPSQDRGGFGTSSKPNTGLTGRPAVPLSPNSGIGGIGNIGDAIVDALINMENRGGGTPPPPVGPATAPNRGNTPSSSNVLFQVLNDRMRTGRGPSSSPFSLSPHGVRDTGRSSVPTGTVRLGVSGRELDGGGFGITSVLRNARGARLGLEPGDVIWKVNGRVVRSVNDIARAINSPSGKAIFVVRNVRDGNLYFVSFNANVR